MHQAVDHFLAGAAFPLDQDGDVGASQPLQAAADLLHRRSVAENHRVRGKNIGDTVRNAYAASQIRLLGPERA